MRVISVVGLSKSGKTTTIEEIIKELKRRNYSVGTIKEIHFHGFKMDVEGTNTHRHRMAGAGTVTARGDSETDIMYDHKLDVNSILSYYSEDFVIMEGVRDTSAPKIITASDEEGIEAKWDDTVFAISGVISTSLKEYKNLPVIDGLTRIEELVDLIEIVAMSPLPDVDRDCCSACGYSCMELSERILKGISKREDCVIDDLSTTLTINGKKIYMVPFVEKILRNTILGVAKELKGYSHKGEISICIKR